MFDPVETGGELYTVVDVAFQRDNDVTWPVSVSCTPASAVHDGVCRSAESRGCAWSQGVTGDDSSNRTSTESRTKEQDVDAAAAA